MFHRQWRVVQSGSVMADTDGENGRRARTRAAQSKGDRSAEQKILRGLGAVMGARSGEKCGYRFFTLILAKQQERQRISQMANGLVVGAAERVSNRTDIISSTNTGDSLIQIY